MTERPILFQDEMIRALMEGRKTQTRRVVKFEYADEVDAWAFDAATGLWRMGVHGGNGQMADMGGIRCPYGVPGDGLYVKEAWSACKCCDEEAPSNIPTGEQIWYPSTGSRRFPSIEPWAGRHHGRGKNRPSIFMPRWASRINLEVKEVRVERVQEISGEDARAEGIGRQDGNAWESVQGSYPIAAFRHLWGSINAKPKPAYKRVDGKRQISHYVSYPWEAGYVEREHRGLPWYVYGNPWVWALTFEVIP